MSEMTSGLVVTDLAVQIGKARIVDSINVSVGPGEVVGIAGRNGAGKTTTLRAISGVIGRTAGTVSLNGKPMPDTPEDVARSGLAHVPEGRGIFASLTVEQNLKIGAMVCNRRDAPTPKDALRTFPQLERFLHSQAGRLSGGEQQMVALARGLASKPIVLMVDEMSLGLSPRALSAAMEALVGTAKRDGIGVLIVDQNTKLLMDWCSRIELLSDGRTSPWDGETDLGTVYFS